jgi:hypothetical protein
MVNYVALMCFHVLRPPCAAATALEATFGVDARARFTKGFSVL